MKLRALLIEKPTASPPTANAEAPDIVSATAAVSTATAVVHSTAVTALILVLALFFLCFFSVYARSLVAGLNHASRRRQRSVASANTARRRLIGRACSRGLDQSTVSSLPILYYVGGIGEETCVVCLAEFEAKEAVKLIPGCGHVFHPGCIDAWLLTRGSCPVCRCTEVLGESSLSSMERVGVQVGLEERKEVVGLEKSGSCSVGSGEEVKVEVVLRRSCSL